MYENLLKENLRIEIELENDPSLDRYPSRVEEVRKNTLLVAIPMRSGTIVPVHVGELVRIKFIHREEVFACETKVIGRRMVPLPVLELNRPSEIRKIQRRFYVRLKVTFDVDFRPVSSEEEFYRGTSIDISGGGVLFISNHAVNVGDIIEMKISLPLKAPLEALARVVRAEKSGIKTNSYLIAVVFENLRESQRDLVISFVFEKQRELLKKGLT